MLLVLDHCRKNRKMLVFLGEKTASRDSFLFLTATHVQNSLFLPESFFPVIFFSEDVSFFYDFHHVAFSNLAPISICPQAKPS